ncbi:uncharacterized protein UV8b_01913 [Ustilaginoidea virens]|uniref:Tubulin-specific chaperone A n=1 Tax=Ustilaginoidea virens TaxID=1159556 RepID=A0A8E5MFD5_USTVR|nr:uncharacterized protein UV8b_01913 [Ustilaginoidea virens]QUC17672.1 hypothetical protein UV8b_01913 [Ustilaginoidea virens]
MPAPSQLAIASGSVTRLLKEEASYHTELGSQEAEIARLEESVQKGDNDDDGNAAFMLKQNRTALEQTRAVFAPLRERIKTAVAKLKDQIALAEEAGGSDELESARKVLRDAEASLE